jgi:dolichyl-phosphate beta-glucosyltransferase
MKLSVVIPVYNEENRIVRTLEEINAYLSRQNYDYEILVVDNGSKDRTKEIVLDLAKKIRGLRLVDGKGGGKGKAVSVGMLAAKGDFRIFTDADNSTTIDQIEKMWPEFEKGYDIVIGSRDIKGAVLNPPQPWLRQVLLGEGYKLYRKIIIGLWSIEDTQCGFKGFTKKAAEEIFPKSKIDYFAFDPEILLLAQKAGYKIKEVPIVWKNDLASKVKPSSIIKMALDLIKIKWNLITRKYN